MALILFYPQGDEGDTGSTPRQEAIAVEAATDVFNILTDLPDSLVSDSSVMTAVIGALSAQPYIKEYILAERSREADSGWYVAIRNHYYKPSDISDPSCIFCEYAQKFLKAEDDFYFEARSPGNKYVDYFFRGGENDEFLLKISTDIVPPIEAQDNLAEIVLLLFLISTLISLLIINLISSGVKKPLKAIINAFEEIGAGQQTVLPEDAADPDIRQLTYAFNEMAYTLAMEKKKLAEANNQLMKANKSLLESESILTSLVDYSPDAIVVTDLDDQVIIYNLTAAGDFGYNQSNLIGRKISNIFSVTQAKKESTEDTNEYLGAKEVICRRSDGAKFPALLVSTPLGPEGSKPIAMLYFFRNISESRNYKEMVLKLDRIAVKGKMARDIAHEINNYLAILQGNIELLPMIIAKNDHEKVADRIGLLKKTVNNIATFTEGLTRFSDENSEFVKEDLNQLVENLIAFLKPQNKFDNIAIGTNLSEYLPTVTIDCSQIQLALTNILTNAAEALENIADPDRKWIVVSTALDESEQHVYIKIANGGPKIDEKNIEKMFVNRFSTKKGGNGLGLITCKNIIDNHFGEISFHATHESQAVFVIKIPANRIGQTDDDPTVQMRADEVPKQTFSLKS